MWLTCELNFKPNGHGQGHFSGAERKTWGVMKFVWRKGSTCKKVSAPVKWPWLCLFGMKFNTHVSHIYLRLNVEGFSTNRLDCRDNWRFHNVYKFPFSCSPSCHPFWRNFSVVIWSGENFWFAVNFKLCTCPRHFSFTYRCTFLFNKICIHDIPINISLIWKYLTRKDTFAILDANLRPLNWKTIRKTTWNLSVLEFLVLKKLFAT